MILVWISPAALSGATFLDFSTMTSSGSLVVISPLVIMFLFFGVFFLSSSFTSVLSVSKFGVSSSWAWVMGIISTSTSASTSASSESSLASWSVLSFESASASSSASGCSSSSSASSASWLVFREIVFTFFSSSRTDDISSIILVLLLLGVLGNLFLGLNSLVLVFAITSEGSKHIAFRHFPNGIKNDYISIVFII
ncbi:unnamed protein product [Moneuplotes crassus]|uniref:Uncharacterized protein n=1 Tax=Euplotes crassus TaxID=5936 RepID=A0AAD1XI45_EUPCR|nr:unnamed protein product [Moneuplotes crassus]